MVVDGNAVNASVISMLAKSTTATNTILMNCFIENVPRISLVRRDMTISDLFMMFLV